MSIFNLRVWVYKILRLYTSTIIFYEKHVKKPVTVCYDSLYNGAITHLYSYDVGQLRKNILYTKPLLEFPFDVWCYLKKYNVCKVVSFNPQQNNGVVKQSGTDYIYDIVCWDGRRYLTRQAFNITKRQVYPKRHKCIHASINDIIDITKFINDYPESFTDNNRITIYDVLAILFLNGYINHDTFYKVVEQNLLLYVIDDESLEVRSFKGNEIICL